MMYGHALEDYLKNWYNTDIADAESGIEMEQRVKGCLTDILEQGEDTLIVAHNGTLTLILKLLNLISEDQLLDIDFQFRFGCYSAVRIDSDKAILEGFNL